MAKIEFGMGFKLDKSGLVQAQNEIKKIKQSLEHDTKLNISGDELAKLKREVEGIGTALDKAFDKDLGKININKLNSELKKANISIDSFRNSLSNAGISGAQAFMGIQKEILRTGTEIRRAKGLVEEMSESIVRTAKWSVSTAAVNAFGSSVSKAVGYIKGMDDSLNNIRIVTGKSASEMKVFEESANKSAKALGKTTKEYADASLIFFQQGKTAAEVKELTEATLIGANITGENVTDMADYLTAALNGYTMEASRAMEVTDKLAAVGAATGSDFAELAIGMSKVASAANVMGVDIDQLSGMLATVTTVTREAPETIGTTFKTIFTRMAELKAGKEDEGWTTGKVEEAMNMIGVSILDEKNQMKDMGSVIEEVGNKWAGLNKESKVGVATAMAGTRQASRLMALFDNWAMYEDSVRVSQEANGTALEQNEVRMDTIAAKSKQLRAEMEEFYRSILNPEMFKGFTDIGIGVMSQLNDIVDGFNSMGGMLSSLGGIAVGVLSKQIAGGLDKVISKVSDMKQRLKEFATQDASGGASQYENAALQAVQEARTKGENGEAGGMSGARADEYESLIRSRIKLREQEKLVTTYLSAEEQKQFQILKNQLDAENEKLSLMRAQRVEDEADAEANLKANHFTEEELRDEEALKAIKEEVSDEIKKQNMLYNQQYEKQKALDNMYKLQNTSYDDMERLFIKTNDELTEQERHLKKILETHGLTEQTLADFIPMEQGRNELGEKLAKIYKEVNDELEKTHGNLEIQEQLMRDINVIQEAGPTAEENLLESSIRAGEQRAEAFERDARRMAKIQSGIEGIGVALQLLGTIDSFKKLSDDSLTFEERMNTISTTLGQLSGTLMGAIPMLTGLVSATTGIVAKIASAALPVVGILVAVTAIGAIIPKIVKHFDPLNKVIKHNEQVLSDYAERIDTLKDKQNGLKDATAKLAEAEQMAADGLVPEELEKYHALVNEAAARSPEMVAYYDAFGNAVMKSKEEVAKMNEELDKNINLAHESMSKNAGSFGEQVVRQTEADRSRKEALEKELEEARRELSEAIEKNKSTKTINEKQAKIDETLGELSKIKERMDELGKTVQQGLINPLIQGNQTIKDMGAGLQGYIGLVLNQGKIIEDLTNVAGDTVDEKVKNAEAYTTALQSSVEKVAKGFANINQEAKNGNEEASKFMDKLTKLPQDIQGVVGKELFKISPGLDQEQINAEIDNLSNYINEKGEFLSFEFAKHVNEITGPQLREGLQQNMQEAIQGAFSNINLNAGEGWFGVGGFDFNFENVLNKITQQAENYHLPEGFKEQIQTLINGGIDQNALDKIAEMSLQSQEFMTALREEISNIAPNLEGGEQGEMFQQILDGLNIALEYNNQIEESLSNQQEIYSDLAGDMADTIDGQMELAEIWNGLIESAPDLEENALFNVDIEAVWEQNEALREFGDVIEGTNEEIREATSDGYMYVAMNESLEEGAKQAGQALLNMEANMGTAQFEKLAELAGFTGEKFKEMAQKAAKGSIDAAKELQKGISMAYAGMKKEDGDYYNYFVKYNSDKIADIDRYTNFSSKNHHTLASYLNDLAKNKWQVARQYMQDEHKDLTDTLRQRIEDEQTATGASVEIGGKAIDAQTRAANLAALGLAKNAVIAAEQGSAGGVEAAAQMISAISSVDKSMKGTLDGYVNDLRAKGVNFQELLNKINAEIARWEAGDNGEGTIKLDKIDIPKFDGLKLPPPPPISTKPPSYNGGGGAPPPSGGSGPSASKPSGGGGGGKKPGSGKKPGKGSGGKGESEKEEKEVEDLQWTADIYHDINIQLKQQDRLLKDLKDQQKKLYGKELLDNLAKQKKALQEQEKLLRQKLELQKQDLANQKAAIAAQGVAFNVDGTIANYNALLAQKLAYVNSLSGEAKEAAKKEFEALVKAMEAYEQLNLDTIKATEDAINKSIEQQREIWLQELDYAIELKIDISGDFIKAIDFLKDMNDEYEDMSENYERTLEQINEEVDLIERLKKKIEETKNNTELTEKERLDRLEKYNKQLQDALKNLKKLDKELTKIFKDTLKDGLDMVKEHSDKFDDLNDRLEHYADMLKLIGEGDNYELLDELYEGQYANTMAQIDIANKTMDQLKARREELKAAGMEGTEEWKYLEEQIQKTQKSIDKLAKESLNILKKEFKNSMDAILSDLEKGLTAGKGFKELKDDMKAIKEERKKYLDNEEKLLAVNKLQQKIQKAIDETDDPARRKELEKFRDIELKKLKEKDKITKYDVDRANQIYDITLKQMALEDQRAAKNMMRLVRDTQGNWVYEFTEDASAIEKAQNDLSDSMEKLMEMDKKKLEETQDVMLKLQEEYYKEVQQIAKDAAEGKYKTEDEVQAALQEAYNKFEEKMKVANTEYLEAKENATISSMGVILDQYIKNGDALGQLTEEQKKLLDALAKKTNGSFLDMQTTVNGLLVGDKESIKKAFEDLGFTSEGEMKSASTAITTMVQGMYENWDTSIGDMLTAINGFKTDNESEVNLIKNTWAAGVADIVKGFTGPEGFKAKAEKAINDIVGKWNEHNKKVGDVKRETGLTTEAIKQGISESAKETENLTSKTDDLITKFGQELEAVTKLTAAYNSNNSALQNNKQSIKDLIDETLKYVDSINKVIDAIKRKNDTEDEANKPKPAPPAPTPPPAPAPPPAPPSGGGSGSGGSGGPGQGNGKVEKGDVVTFHSGSYMYSSEGVRPTGHVLRGIKDAVEVDMISPLPANRAPYQYHLRGHGKYSANRDLGWVKADQISGFDTGGYTGAWGSEGKLAMLHEKEIVLNKQDTGKILEAVQLVRGISGNALNSVADVIAQTSRKTISALGGLLRTVNTHASGFNHNSNEGIQQNIEINADFSGVKNSDEIEKAFENMANMASQYVNRR